MTDAELRALLRLPERVRWMERAACKGLDPEMFFPEKGQAYSVAREACARCEVAAECLEHALATGEMFGMWGGAPERERRQLRRQRRQAS